MNVWYNSLHLGWPNINNNNNELFNIASQNTYKTVSTMLYKKMHDVNYNIKIVKC